MLIILYNVTSLNVLFYLKKQFIQVTMMDGG